MSSFQTYSWSIGTTSFRVTEINFLIERQLQLLEQFWSSHAGQSWEANQPLQAAYYDLLAAEGLLKPHANNKPKDAREKTSALKELGLVTSGRRLTAVGQTVVGLVSAENIQNKTNIFGIESDAYVYLRQLLKLKADKFEIRPFVATLYLLDKLEYLGEAEFTYLLPLCRTAQETQAMCRTIRRLRAGEVMLETILMERLISMPNYREALHEFLATDTVSEASIAEAGINRKSPRYDRPYFAVYQALQAAVSAEQPTREHCASVLAALQAVTPRPRQRWLKLLFGTSRKEAERLAYFTAWCDSSPLNTPDEKVFREAFFWRLHLIKWLTNLEDYADLNKRYFGLSDILIMKDQKIELQIFAKYYFRTCIDALLLDRPASTVVEQDVELPDISAGLSLNTSEVFGSIERVTGQRLTPALARTYVEDERRALLDRLIEERFSREQVVGLLESIERRDDALVQAQVTDNADVPTIFEYIIGICWYYLSGKSFDLLNAYNLSLDANMLPKQHAGGGMGDVVVSYQAGPDYPAHRLLIEATLTNRSQQRRAEMEPVSRHLGDLLAANPEVEAYGLFMANYLDPNVIFDFRGKKHTPYVSGAHTVDGLKIIPLDTGMLRTLLTNNVTYAKLYALFTEAYASDVSIRDWFDQEIKHKIPAL